MKIKLVITILAVVLLASCHKENNTPKDFIKCKVNGEDWQAGDNTSFANDMYIHWSFGGQGFLLYGTSASNSSLNIALSDTVNGITSGTYKLNTSLYNSATYNDYNLSSSHFYATDSNNTGLITIAFDEIKKRATGTFAFTAKYNDNLNDKSNIIVTNGSFSLPCEKH